MYALLSTLLTLIIVTVIYPPAGAVLIIFAGALGLFALYAKSRDRSK